MSKNAGKNENCHRSIFREFLEKLKGKQPIELRQEKNVGISNLEISFALKDLSFFTKKINKNGLVKLLK